VDTASSFGNFARKSSVTNVCVDISLRAEAT
jgi:hypothetical protein